MTAPQTFVFGAQYYRPPNPPRSDWERDLQLMRASGMNTVKYWACWAWMHTDPDQVVFDEFDDLMELAVKAELKVVINVILENAPYWLERREPDSRYCDHEGHRITLRAAMNTPAGGWPGLCFDNPEPRQHAKTFIDAVVQRYRSHPALAVWDIWNEPHLEPTWSYPERTFCYCDASISAFRAWLRQRYSTLSDLNQAWRRRYSDWAEVEPPRASETYPDYLDWTEFWLTNLRRWLEWKAALFRATDDTHPLMTHVASSAYLGTLATNIWDEWLLADPVDLYGTSSFPRWLMAGDDPAVHLFHLEMVRDAAQGRPVWQAELQGGRGRREGLASTPHPTPRSVTSWIWHDLAIGCKGVMFWQWRPELLGPESPGYGLCSPSGAETERVQAATQMASLIDEFPELSESVPEPADAAILVSRKTPLLAYATERSMQLYANALLGTYRALLDGDIPVQFIHEDIVEARGVPSTVKVLYWPMPNYSTETLAAQLQSFVAGGGHLVAEGGPGAYVEHGMYAEHIPPYGLAEVFGGSVRESDIAPNSFIRGANIAMHVDWSIDRLITDGATVIATFEDGSPAILEHQFGDGVATLIGASPSLAYETTREPGARAWIAGHALQAKEAVTGLMQRTHTLPDGRAVLFFVNLTDESLESTVGLSGRTIERHSKGLTPRTDRVEVRLMPRAGAIAVTTA